MDTNIYKTKLEEEKKLLIEELSSVGKVNEDGDWQASPEEGTNTQEVQDEADMAERSEEYEERAGVLDPLETRLADINKALSKIENGDYGICEVCGVKIEDDRLEANPSSKTCKACMETIM